MTKPTGSIGENGDRVCRCIGIEKKNIAKTHSGFLGDLPEEEGNYMPSPSGSNNEEDEDDGIVVEVEGGGGVDFVAEEVNESSFETDRTEIDGEEVNESSFETDVRNRPYHRN